MQSALAMVVRYSDSFDAESVESFLADFDLTPTERESVKQLAVNRELGKFGRGLQDMRWSMITVRMPLTLGCVDENTLFELFNDGFDPISYELPNYALPYEFLRFLETDEKARAIVAKSEKPWVGDFLAF